MDKRDSHEIEGMRELRNEIPPQRDLWPDIEARLGARQQPAAAPVPGGRAHRRWGAGAVAAAIALAFLGGLLTGREVAVPEARPQLPLTVQQAAAPALTVALRAAEAEYAAAYKALMPLSPSFVALDEAHRQGMEDSWATMARTELALKAALAEHPDSRFLGARLLSLRAQQLEFMRQLHLLEQNTWRTT